MWSISYIIHAILYTVQDGSRRGYCFLSSYLSSLIVTVYDFYRHDYTQYSTFSMPKHPFYIHIHPILLSPPVEDD